MHDAPLQTGTIRFAGETGDLHVAEPVIGEARFPDFLAIPFQDIRIGLKGTFKHEFD